MLLGTHIKGHQALGLRPRDLIGSREHDSWILRAQGCVIPPVLVLYGVKKKERDAVTRIMAKMVILPYSIIPCVVMMIIFMLLLVLSNSSQFIFSVEYLLDHLPGFIVTKDQKGTRGKENECNCPNQYCI